MLFSTLSHNARDATVSAAAGAATRARTLVGLATPARARDRSGEIPVCECASSPLRARAVVNFCSASDTASGSVESLRDFNRLARGVAPATNSIGRRDRSKIAKTETRALSDALRPTRQPIRSSFLHVDSKRRPRLSVFSANQNPADWPNDPPNSSSERNIASIVARLGHIRTRFNATHLSTPTENNACIAAAGLIPLRAARVRAPPPRSPPRCVPRARLRARDGRSSPMFFWAVTASRPRTRAGRAGSRRSPRPRRQSPVVAAQRAANGGFTSQSRPRAAARTVAGRAAARRACARANLERPSS